METKRPHISGVIIGAVAPGAFVHHYGAGLDGDRVSHLLNLSLPLHRLFDLLKENLTPPARRHRRPRRPDPGALRAVRRVCRQTRGSRLPGATRNAGAVWVGTNNSGEAVRTAFTHGVSSGWVIYVSTPEATIQSALRESFWAISALGVVLTIVAC